MLKKLTAVLLSAVIVVLSIPVVRSSAATIVVPEDDSTHYYLYNHVFFDDWSYDDFLTQDNYTNYFNALSGNDKTEFVNTFLLDSRYGQLVNDFIDPSYAADSSQILAIPHITVDGVDIPYDDLKVRIIYAGNINQFIVSSFYCPSGDEVLNIGSGTFCKSPFYSSAYVYYMSFTDGHYHFQQTDYASNVLASIDSYGLYSFVTDNYNFSFLLYSNSKTLFLGNSNTFPDLDNFGEVFNAYENNNTLAIDRRTNKFLEKLNGDSGDNTIINDADLMNFKGELGFESFSFKSYIDKNADLVFPSYVVNYKYNNYTDLRKDNVLLYVDYNFDFKLTFRMAGGTVGYQTVNMQNMSVEDITDNRNAFGGDLNALISQSSNIKVRETSGLHLQSNDIVGYEDVSQFQASSLIANLGRYFYKIMNNPVSNHVVTSKRDSYFYIYIDFYLVDKTDGLYQESKHIKRRIDYWGDPSNPTDDFKTPAINDIDNSGIIDDDEAYQNFIDSYNSNNTSEDAGYINYLPSVNNGGSNSQVGDITIYQNPYPYLLVDIPEGEWMNKTPRLTTILTDFKDALSEVKNDSILNVMSETYNYLPVPVWQYFTYGVGILIAIGIWRGITRR